MNHVEHLIPDWLDDRLDAADRERVREHCAVCDACRAALEESRDVWALLGETEAPEPASVWPGIERSLARTEPLWLRWSFPAAAAAVLALGFVVGERFVAATPSEAWSTGQEIVAGTSLADDAAWSLDDMVSVALSVSQEED